MSIEFDRRPVRRSRGPDTGVLLLIGLAAFVGLAVVKPWEFEPDQGRSRPTASPNVAASDAPNASHAADLTSDAAAWADLARLFAQSRSVMGALPVHDRLGLRVIMPREPGQAEGAQPDGTLVAIVGGDLVERWHPVEATRDASWWGQSSWLAGVTNERPALAIGLTIPPGHTALDVRFYRYSSVGSAPIPIAASDLGLDPAGADRLFVAPVEGGPSPAWPTGRFVAQVLLGSRIETIGFTVPAGPPPIPDAPDPLRFAPTTESVRAALGDATAGVFAIDAAGEASVAAALAGRQLDPRRAWLALAEPVGDGGPRVASLPVRSAAVIGVILPRGSVLQAASLWAAAPETRSLAANRLSISGAVTPPTIAFAPPGAGRWPAGLYRITARYWDPAYRLREWSWHIELGAEAMPRPLLMAAAAPWPNSSGEEPIPSAPAP